MTDVLKNRSFRVLPRTTDKLSELATQLDVPIYEVFGAAVDAFDPANNARDRSALRAFRDAVKVERLVRKTASMAPADRARLLRALRD